jgi:hypothetical protein
MSNNTIAAATLGKNTQRRVSRHGRQKTRKVDHEQTMMMATAVVQKEYYIFLAQCSRRGRRARAVVATPGINY